MSKLLRNPYPTQKPVTATDLKNTYIDVGKVLNGNIEHGTPTDSSAQNVNGVWFTGTTPATPDTEFQIPLNINRVPTGWGPFSIDQAGILYRSTTPWTTTAAYMKCNVASANVSIFLT